jgi:hypothetical protein
MSENTDQIKQYLTKIIDFIKTKEEPNTQTWINPIEYLFNTLVHHDFCYLTRTQIQPYKPQIIEAIKSTIQSKKPLPIYLDLGPGYHAALEKKDPRNLSFEVGLGELLVLYQMKKFINRVTGIYPHGAKFGIVIDNVCAVFVNDIPTIKTEGYCEKFRELISELGVENEIKLLVESEHFSTSDYDVRPVPEEQIKSHQLTEEDHDNCERFLGHKCTEEDAIRRILIYKQIGDRTDELFAEHFNNAIHATQRASKTTISFRPFPGGDSRIQSGRVVLSYNNNKKLYPFLMTSTNYSKYSCKNLLFPDVLPKPIQEITFVKPI